MRRIVVRPGGGGPYPIQIGRGALRQVASSLRAAPLGDRYAIITDHNVRDIFALALQGHLQRAGIDSRIFSFAPGEGRKNLSTFESLSGRMLKAGFSRTDAIIALGGGVVGDMAGYVAAAYMRGIPYVGVPTTLLAMVDSSIGGKVAVDLPGGKNIVGHFWHPSRVFIDPRCLESLPSRERRSGWVEIIKHGVIGNPAYFDRLERNGDRLMKLKGRVLEEILAGSLRIKAKVVALDEKESGLRRILNYGHTVGHAIESLTGYGKYTHGEAVAMGMAVEGRIALLLGLWEKDDLARQNRLLRKLRLKISSPKIPAPKLLRAIRRDKKVAHGVVYFALPGAIGAMGTRSGWHATEVDPRVIRRALQETAG